MTAIGCTHRKVTTYVFVDGNQPAGLWACADCGHKFEPVNISAEQDAERYRWLAARMLAADFDYTGDRIQALVFEMPDGFQASADCGATIDAAMLMAPAVGAA